MSTKIWVAYKLRRAEYLWPLVHDIRLKATKNVKKVLEEFYLKHLPDVKTESSLYQKRLKLYQDICPDDPERVDYRARLAVVQDFLTRAYRMSTTSPRRNPYNFDVSVGFRQYDGKIVVIPYCDWTMTDTLDFLAKDKRLRDYHYQNQADRPDDLNARQWGERRRYYDRMFDSGQWEDVLVLDICKWDMWYRIDPAWDMIRKTKKTGRSNP